MVEDDFPIDINLKDINFGKIIYRQINMAKYLLSKRRFRNFTDSVMLLEILLSPFNKKCLINIYHEPTQKEVIFAYQRLLQLEAFAKKEGVYGD